jgi:pyridinium-3,5-bisthiocarboxylic acid mononucleotide nickel chelatase
VGRLAYLDCIGGLAGDMLAAALLDAGGDAERLRSLPRRLGLGEIDVEVEQVERRGVRALQVRFHGAEDGAHRSWGSIRALLESAELDEIVRARSLDAFARLARAEAAARGRADAEELDFEEQGEADTILDLCGVAELLYDLEVDRVASAPLPLAHDIVPTARGRLAVPTPAMLVLLRGARLAPAEIGGLVTPTGATIAAAYVDDWGAPPPLVVERVGFGAGTRELPARPNVVRVLLGTREPEPRAPEVVP